MTKQEQINTLIDRLEKLESEYTRLHEEQRRDVLDNLERYGKTIQLFDKHNRDIDRLNTIVERLDEFEKCRKCPAWSGTDCTRNPYTDGCLDDKVNLKNEIKRLEKENRQLKTECALLDDELRIARQDTIDVLNKLKEKAFDKDAFNGWAGSTFVVLVRDIDKMIEELIKNAEDKS